MGGDQAPAAIVQGAALAARTFKDELEIILVGEEPAIAPHLSASERVSLGIELVHSTETIGMSEAAPSAYRRKPGASISVAARLVKDGAADALVSAGNTGAVVTASLLCLGRVRGVDRPAIASIIPTRTGQCILLDVGANADTKPQHLVQFALMGKIYAELVQGIAQPRVGLLNIGEEASKGSELTQQAHKFLANGAVNIHFIGNVEGRDVLTGEADVVVCDGFTGNVLLKFAESVIGLTTTLLRQELERSLLFKLAALLLKPAFQRLKNRMNYEEYGGAPLLGVNGAVIIAHGRSSPKAIMNAIRVAAMGARQRVDVRIGEELAREFHRQEAVS